MSQPEQTNNQIDESENIVDYISVVPSGKLSDFTRDNPRYQQLINRASALHIEPGCCKCPFCHVGYNHISHCLRHISTNHQDQNVPAGELVVWVRGFIPAMPLGCPFCKFFTLRINSMYVHLLSRHNSVLSPRLRALLPCPVPCPVDGCTFSTFARSTLMSHMLVVHHVDGACNPLPNDLTIHCNKHNLDLVGLNAVLSHLNAKSCPLRSELFNRSGHSFKFQATYCEGAVNAPEGSDPVIEHILLVYPLASLMSLTDDELVECYTDSAEELELPVKSVSRILRAATKSHFRERIQIMGEKTRTKVAVRSGGVGVTSLKVSATEISKLLNGLRRKSGQEEEGEGEEED